MPQAFRNLLLLFPPNILKEVNLMIDSGNGCINIKKVLDDRYKGNLKVPSHDTIQRYIDWYKENKSSPNLPAIAQLIVPSEIVGKQQLEEVKSKVKRIVKSGEIPYEDKKKMLEDLVSLCYQRMNVVEAYLQQVGMNQTWEQILGSYIRESRSTIEALAKLSGDMKGENEEIVKEMVDKFLYQLIVIFIQVVREIYGGEKLSLVKERLSLRMKERSIEVNDEQEQSESKTDEQSDKK